jgi:hypothetical protein
MNVLPPGWEVPDTLPAGVTVAPAADPQTAARVIAERVGGEIVVDVATAERALARQAARRRAERVVADAAEAASLLSLLEGSDPAADRALLAAGESSAAAAGVPASGEVARLAGVVGDVTADADDVRAAAARLRVAEVTAEAAAEVVGERPAALLPEVELVRARSLAAAASSAATDAARDAEGLGSASSGVMAMSVGATLLLVASGVGVETAALIPGLAGAGAMRGWRRRRHDARRLRVEADDAAADAERARAAWTRVDAELRAWEARNDEAVVAAAELDDARRGWSALVGDVPVERADRLVEALEQLAPVREAVGLPAGTPPSEVVFACSRAEQSVGDAAGARAREVARARLRDVLHGRPIDRLLADAAAARAVLATPAPAAVVLCDPFASLGPGRRRALLRDLERAAANVALALVTSDEEARSLESSGALATAAR